MILTEIGFPQSKRFRSLGKLLKFSIRANKSSRLLSLKSRDIRLGLKFVGTTVDTENTKGMITN